MLSDVWSHVFRFLRCGPDWISLALVEKSALDGFHKFQRRRLGHGKCIGCGTRLQKHRHHNSVITEDRCQRENGCACIPLHLPLDQQEGWWMCHACSVFYYQCPSCEDGHFCRLIEHAGEPLFGFDFFRLDEANDFDDEVLNDFTYCNLSKAQPSPSSSTSVLTVHYFISDFRWPRRIVRIVTNRDTASGNSPNGSHIHKTPLTGSSGYLFNRMGYNVSDRHDLFLDTSQWFPFSLDCSRPGPARVDKDRRPSTLVWQCDRKDKLFLFRAGK